MDVFIVDDDPGALNSLRFLLESDGLRVSAFRSGQELLAELPRANPDCVIIDFKMPAMDGLDVYRNLRQLNDAVPVNPCHRSPRPIDSRQSRTRWPGIDREASVAGRPAPCDPCGARKATSSRFDRRTVKFGLRGWAISPQFPTT
jgi:CheY-like chemotaxis protein